MSVSSPFTHWGREQHSLADEGVGRFNSNDWTEYLYNSVFIFNVLIYIGTFILVWFFAISFCQLFISFLLLLISFHFSTIHMQHYTVKKVTDIPVPISGMSPTKLCLGGNNLIFSPRESKVSDIPTGDGNVSDLFYGVYCKYRYKTACGDRWNWFGVVCVLDTGRNGCPNLVNWQFGSHYTSSICLVAGLAAGLVAGSPLLKNNYPVYNMESHIRATWQILGIHTWSF